MAEKRWAVVLSSDAIGLGATRSLGVGGIPTIVVMQHRWEPVRFSRYGGWRIVAPRRPEHVAAFYTSQRHALGRVIAQEMIPGADTDWWECIGVFDYRHELRTAFTFRKLRTVPAHFGQTSHGRSERN